MESLKVFAMDDNDLVAARNEEEAKSWYEQFIPRNEVEEYFQGEVSLEEKIVISKSEVSEQENQNFVALYGEMPEEDTFEITLKEWLKVLLPVEKPFIIASSEGN